MLVSITSSCLAHLSRQKSSALVESFDLLKATFFVGWSYLKYFAVATFAQHFLKFKIFGTQFNFAWIDILLRELYGLLAFITVAI